MREGKEGGGRGGWEVKKGGRREGGQRREEEGWRGEMNEGREGGMEYKKYLKMFEHRFTLHWGDKAQDHTLVFLLPLQRSDTLSRTTNKRTNQ